MMVIDNTIGLHPKKLNLLEHLVRLLYTTPTACLDSTKIEARIEARAIIRHFLDDAHCFDLLDDVDTVLLQKMTDLALKRAQKIPMAYLLGTKEFYSIALKQTSSALIARADSEVLVDAALRFINIQGLAVKPNLSFLDIGTGSGCLLLACLAQFPAATGIGIDVSYNALKLAQENATLLKMDSRASFICSNWGDGMMKSFDIILTNPPYIPSKQIKKLQNEVRNYEPLLALDGGKEGVCCYESIAKRLKRFMKPHTHCFVEIGINQREDVTKIFENSSLRIIEIIKDLSNIERCLVVTS